MKALAARQTGAVLFASFVLLTSAAYGRASTDSLACLAAVAEHRADDADRLAVNVLSALEGNKGWPYVLASPKNCAGPNTLDAFHDGTCNGPETSYAYETGLAATCLARTSLLTNKKQYAVTARLILQRWRDSVSSRPCPNCIYFWYSDNVNDADRYVRNTNVLMGMAAAWTFAATGDPDMEEIARGVAASERREAQADNFGYFGIDDPKFKANPAYERFRIENHLPYVAKGLLDIGFVTKSEPTMALGLDVMRSWMTCGGRDCSRRRCALWAGRIDGCRESQIAAPCFFARRNKAMSQTCSEVKASLPKPNTYQRWAISDSLGP